MALLYSVNRNVKIAVKTPVGKTDRGTIRNVITQGDVFGPLLCSTQVDSFGKECLDENKYTYMYKGEVEIPPLGMVGDLLCISECGYKTAMLNMKFKTNSQKLKFGVGNLRKSMWANIVNSLNVKHFQLIVGRNLKFLMIKLVLVNW